MARPVCLFVSAALMLAPLGCGDSDDDSGGGAGGNDPQDPGAVDGTRLYGEPHEDGNTFACGTCHALAEPLDSGLRRPGHPIGDAWARPHFKNGRVEALRGAVNSCRQEWMGTTPFGADDERWLALEGYLREQADDLEAGAAPPLSFSVAALPEDLMGGDPEAGHTLFNQTCVVCHGVDGVGTERALRIAGTRLGAETVARRTRTSGAPGSDVYDGLTGGRMPFWSAERLTDGELNDLIAYLAMTEPMEMPDDAIGPAAERADISAADVRSGCGADHPQVGATLTLSTKFHQVAGTVTVVDDCTLEFDGFTFDGAGIDVRIYGGTAGDYSAGPALSGDFVGQGFDGGAAVLKLPTGVTLDDFDGVSVWCVAVGISFGDGLFAL